jgi:hypothetical protein
MGNVKHKIILKRKRRKSGVVEKARYCSKFNTMISRVFFESKTFSLVKGTKYLEEIYNLNSKAKLIFTGGGFYEFKIPKNLTELDYLKPGESNKKIKKYIINELKSIGFQLAKLKAKVPLFLGIDFWDDQRNKSTIQLAVLFYKQHIHIFSKRYPVIGEILIPEWCNRREVVLLVGLGRVLPLVCNDGILWAGRSEKTLAKNSKRGVSSRVLKKRFRKYNPNLMLDFIHGIDSSKGKRSGRIFSSSINSYNRRFSGLGLGAFGSTKTLFLKKLASSKNVPSKIRSLSGDAFEERSKITVSDFYIF